MNKIKVVFCEPEKNAYVGEIENDLEAMQKYVGGNIEVAYPTADSGVVAVMNEDGKGLALPICRLIRDEYTGKITDVYVGNVFFCGSDIKSGEFTSLTDAQIESVARAFQRPFKMFEVRDD